MERINPKLLEFNPKTGKWSKACGLDYCDARMYANGYCHNHYEQIRRIGYPTPRVQLMDYPPCKFAGCKNKSVTKTGNPYCQAHRNHMAPTHHTYTDGNPRPLKHYMNEGYTENGRVCRTCKAEKPLTEFYDRNQWKGASCKSKDCKECYKKDVEYYQGKRATKADGTDPLNYADNPEEQQRRVAKRKKSE